MEKVPLVTISLLSLLPHPHDSSGLIHSTPSPPSKFSRKPPFSPPRPTKQPQDPPQYSPSPTKKRQIPMGEKTSEFTLIPTNNEIKLFTNPTKQPTRTNFSTKPKKNFKKHGKVFMNHSFAHHISPQSKVSPKKSLNSSSFYSPYKTTTSESSKTRIFTPVLTEKRRKTPETEEFCKRISLFDSGLNKNFISADTCSTFKDQSTRIEDSTTMGEITPIKQEDTMRDEVNDFSFNSPVNIIKVLNSPEELIVTPEARRMNMSEMAQRPVNEFLAPRKANLEFFSPESNVFVLSSSSELISEMSICEDAAPCFGDISVVPGCKGIDKEMQTDVDLKRVLDILGNQDVIDGLKLIGKFKDILRIINSN